MNKEVSSPLTVDLLKLEDIKKNYYHSKRYIPAGKKIVLAPINASIKAAEKLQEQLPYLSFVDFPNLDEDDDSDLLQTLNSKLTDFLWNAKRLKDKESRHKNKLTTASINKRADNNLVDELASICDQPTCSKSHDLSVFTGRYVDFLRLTFPYLGISCDEIQSYARRFYDLRQNDELKFTTEE